MSITINNEDNVSNDSLRQHQTSETKNITSVGDDTNNDLEKFLQYKKLIETEKISKKYIEGGIAMDVKVDKIKDADWPIVLDEMQNKEHPIRDLRLSWKWCLYEAIKPGFYQLAKIIGAHSTLDKLCTEIRTISADEKTAVLFEALKDNNSIKHLSVVSVNFNDETACAFTEALMNNKSLLSLDFYADNFSGDQREPIFPMWPSCAVELARLLPTTALEQLKIRLINDEDFKLLAPSLPNTLLHLDLSNNELHEESIPVLQSYLKSNGSALEVLILDIDFMKQYLQQRESSSLSTVKIIKDENWHADLFRKEKRLSIKPHEMNDSDWFILFTELTKDVPICREIELNFSDESDRNRMNYLQALLGKQFQLKNLTITDSLSDKEIQGELFRLLKENNFITKLQLSNKMNLNILNELVLFLTNNNTIIHLELSSCSNIGDKEAIMLAESLKTNTVLQSLVLNQNDIGDTGFQALLSSLSNSLSKLKVKDNLISGKSLPSLLLFIKTHPMLKELFLNKNNITMSSAPELNVADLMEQIFKITNANHCICDLKINTKMKQKIAQSKNDYISLYNEDVRDDDILELYNELKKEPNRNWALNLDYNFLITPNGFRYLADIMTSEINIVDLSVGSNNMNEEARSILLNSLHNKKNLQRFGMTSEKLDNQDMENIGSFIHNNLLLKELRLYNCQIETDGVVHLSKFLPESSLETLDLGSNSLDDQACANILSSIPITLTKLELGFNQITESSLQTFLNFFATNKTLKKLDIIYNPIRDRSTAERDNCIQQLKDAADENNICELRTDY